MTSNWIDEITWCELMYKILKICLSLSSFVTMVLKKIEMTQIWKDTFSFQIHIRFWSKIYFGKMRLPINPKTMYPIPAPMFGLSLKFAHNSWHSQYKSIVAKSSPSLRFAPFCFSPQPWHSPQKCFKSDFINVLGMLWETLGMASDVLLWYSRNMGGCGCGKWQDEKCSVPKGGPRADWGQRGKDLQQYKTTDWPTTHMNNYGQT